MRLTRNHKLATKAEFKKVFHNPLKISLNCLMVLYRFNQKEHARIGIIVPKRVVNKAVARNRIKRVVRDSFRLNQEKLVGWDIVIIARSHCDTLSKGKIRKGIDDLWEKLLKHYPKRALS